MSSVPLCYTGAGLPGSCSGFKKGGTAFDEALGRQALSGFVKFQKQFNLPKMPKIKGLSRHLHIRSSAVKKLDPDVIDLHFQRGSMV